MSKWFEVNVSVEKVITRTIEAENEDQAIELIKEQLMNGREDFAQILDVDIEEIED